jgi:hypothetical protein
MKFQMIFIKIQAVADLDHGVAPSMGMAGQGDKGIKTVIAFRE